MTSNNGSAIVGLLWIIVPPVLFSLFMAFLRAPSVVAARPELPELSFWTALFSGRFMSWLFHQSAIAGGLVVTVLWVLILVVFAIFN